MAVDGGTILDFNNPLDSLLLMGFGLVYWTISTAVRTTARYRDKVVEISRHNPWFVLFHKRPMTREEAEARMPRLFFAAYGAFGLVGQVVGLLIGTYGLVRLIIALVKLVKG